MNRYHVASLIGVAIVAVITGVLLGATGEQSMSLRNGVGLALALVIVLGYGPLVITYFAELIKRRDGSLAYTFLGVGIVFMGLGWLILLLRPEYFPNCTVDHRCYRWWVIGATLCWIVSLVFKALALVLEPRRSLLPAYFAIIVAVAFGAYTALRAY